MRQRARRWVMGCGAAGLAAGVAAGLWWATSTPSGAEPSGIENPTQKGFVWGAYQLSQTHAVMERLHGDLEALLDGFLTGNTETIVQYADLIATALLDASQSFPAAPAEQQEVWEDFRQITDEAKRLQAQAHQGLYHQAYHHFVTLSARCIQCHQARRGWGTFSERPTGAPPAP